MPATFSPRPIFTGGESQLNMKYPASDSGDQFNMQAPSPVVNQGGPGNPNGASNMPKVPNNYWKGPAYDNSGINPQQLRDWNALPADERAKYDPETQRRMGGQLNDLTRGPMPQFGGMGGFPYPRAGQGNGDPNGARGPDPRQGQMGGYQDPFNQYGNAGQSPQLGRYVPPMMNNPNGNNQDWTGGGGYSYNIPNSYGSPQWNQFNSTDRANPSFGQSPGISGGGQGRGYNYPPMPQFNSPYARPDQQRSQQYQQYMMSLAQGQVPQGTIQPQGQGPTMPPQGQAPQPVPNNPSMTVMPQLQSNPY